MGRDDHSGIRRPGRACSPRRGYGAGVFLGEDAAVGFESGAIFCESHFFAGKLITRYLNGITTVVELLCLSGK